MTIMEMGNVRNSREMTMPFYRILSRRGTINSDQKARLVEEIVQLHLRLAGGARALVNVLFEEFAQGDFFVGGKPAPRLVASASIRARLVTS